MEGGEIRLDGEEEEMMRWLEREINSPTTSDYGRGTPFVTINGNDETCGPSFSDSASTVMASVDTRRVGGRDYFFVGWPSDPVDVGAAAGSKGVGPWDGGSMLPETAITEAPGGRAVEEVEGDDNAWLARVVGGAGFELELEEEEEENLHEEKVGERSA